MEPTLLVGDHILVNKFIYGVKIPFIRNTIIPISKPQRDDVIVFIYPHDTSKDYIKRVIGLPGDRIEIFDRKININGTLYEDKHGVYSEVRNGASPNMAKNRYRPVIVPENHLFVMGDNRDHSSDSRVWGFVPLKSVKGKAFIIYWSWPHWKRFLHIVR
jgi:signal peptidase I